MRVQTSQGDVVEQLLGPTANPENPSEVDVSQPSAALVAQADAQGAFDGLFWVSAPWHFWSEPSEPSEWPTS